MCKNVRKFIIFKHTKELLHVYIKKMVLYTGLYLWCDIFFNTSERKLENLQKSCPSPFKIYLHVYGIRVNEEMYDLLYTGD